MKKEQFLDIALSTGSGALGGSALGLPGTIAGGAIGLAGGIAGAVAENKMIQRNDSLKAERLNRYRETLSLNSGDIYGFKPRGNNLGGYYKFGGRVNSSGGKFKSLSSTGKLIIGKKHEQGGVHLKNGAEVEGGEVMIGDKVYSDSVPFGKKSFAKVALELSKKQGKAEEDMMKASKKRNKYKYNAAKRLSDLTKEELEGLFEVQEEVTQEMGLQQGEGGEFWAGGDVGSGNIPMRDINYTGDPYMETFMKHLTRRPDSPNLSLIPSQSFTQDPKERYNMGIKTIDDLSGFSGGGFGSKFKRAVYATPYREALREHKFNPGVIDRVPIDHTYSGSKAGKALAVGRDIAGRISTGGKNILSSGVEAIKGINEDGTLNELAPFLSDNLQSMIMNRRLRRMEIPEPSYMTPVGLDKRVDISGSLSELEAMRGSTNRAIDRGIADTSTALAMKSRSSHAATIEKGKLYDYKSNLERQILNQEKQMNKGIEERNLAAFDQHRASSFAKDMQTEITNPSANMINAIEDYRYIKDKQDAKARDLLAMNYRNIASGDKMLDENYVSSIYNYDPNSAEKYVMSNVKNQEDFERFMREIPRGKVYDNLIKWGNKKGYRVITIPRTTLEKLDFPEININI